MTVLTPLGQRTLAGFEAKWGKQGKAKFEQALNDGLIDRTKMENLLLNPDKPAAKKAKSDAGTRGAPEHDTVTSMEGTPKSKTIGSVGRAASGSFQARPG